MVSEKNLTCSGQAHQQVHFFIQVNATMLQIVYLGIPDGILIFHFHSESTVHVRAFTLLEQRKREI
jgi:hypothetical protein